jgi:RNA polymerase-binding transcription factor DksA
MKAAAALRKGAEVEELTNAANAGAICEQLKVERKEVCQSLSAIGTLVQTEVGELEGGKSSDVRKVEWQHREWMQDPLHYIDHAFECLLGAAYGRCRACGEALGTGRLATEPAVALCLVCQRNR